MTIVQDLVKNIVNTEFNDFDTQTIDYAKMRIADTVGALIGGINSSGVDMALDMVREWGGAKESTLLGIGDKLPAANAVLVMGIAARSNDLEPAGGPDIDGKKSPGHYSATTVPTAFAITEKLNRSGKELISAIILGDDLASRIGCAGAAPWDIGWNPSGTCSRFAAAAVVSKLMGLNEGQMVNALSIAFNQIAGTMQSDYDCTHCFKVSQGLAGWNGIISAELAKRGFTGPKDPLMSQFGYYKQYCREVDKRILTKDLGKKFYGDEEFKLYPCCRGNAGSIETALKLVQENDIDPNKIIEINISLSPMWKDSFLIQPFEIGPCVQASAIVNLRYNVANAFLRKGAKLEHYTDESIRDPRIVEIAKKIKINTSLSGQRMSSQIRVKMENGRELSAFTEVPKGNYPNTALTKEEINIKFRASAAFSKAISSKKAEKAIDLFDKLETLDNLDDLIETLTPDTKDIK